jgi:hypothetical protein
VNHLKIFQGSKRRLILLLLLIFCNTFVIFPQGFNHSWMLGHDTGFPMGKLTFTDTSIALIFEQRPMTFEATQGNISDINGNLLISSNGLSVANSLNNTMPNGSGLNPTGTGASFTKNIPYSNLILPWPGDSTKYIMFHHTSTFDGTYHPSYELYYSVVDITLDSGLGEVVQKNIVVFQDTLIWGIAACKHANGRDWWVVMNKDKSDITYIVLLTDTGIASIITQDLNINTDIWNPVTQPTFSPDGRKFAYSNSYFINGAYNLELRLLDFDRCTGIFSNPKVINIEYGIPGTGVAFSPNSKFLYVASYQKIFQLNTDTIDIPASLKTVAINDGFYSPWPPFQTDFKSMYLAANGKIYITSGNSVQHHHIISNPNLEDTLCDVQQHGLDLNGIWNFRSVPNHPNYYLGCDTTLGCTPCYVIPNVTENVKHDFKFNIYPNPSNGNFNIIYLLPQNKEGKLEIIDITGKAVYEMRLPQWSTLQQISLPSHISNGLYNCVITSDNNRVSKRIAILKN